MELDIRPYQKGDYEKYIQSLTKENMQKLFLENFGGWSDSVSEKKFFEVLKTGFVRLFFLNNEFIGYVSLNSEKNNPSSGLINDIHLIKEHQRKGYGSEILKLVEEQAITLNYNQLKVFVFKANPSVNFYKKHRFQESEYIEHSKTYVLIKKLD
ncbi:MAG: GNAT family N-acetyltransferase [Nanoarchaeota archaeon]|nr:GNAT family N-acetyltransferase [Nanoarchaeota archaeon]